MIHKIKHMKIKVKELLIQVPHLRDSDDKLITTIWYHEVKDEMKYMSGMEMLRTIAEGLLSSTESITRARRLCQEQNPELRGKSYKVRKQKAVEVKQQINSI